MKRLPRIPALVAAVLLLASCSATKLAYNNLDWLISWQVGKFVDLEGPSQELFDSGVRSLWQWHRRTQLQLYRDDLHELAQAVKDPLSPEQVKAYVARAQAHADRVAAEALPEASRVLAALSDAQVQGLLERMAEDRRERAEDRAEQTLDDEREAALGRMQKGLKRWLGSVTAEQKARTATWSRNLRSDPAAETAIEVQWSEAFAALLKQRREPEFASRMAQLVQDPQLPGRGAIEALQEYNQAAGVALLSELSQGLGPQQRRHLQGELEQLATELGELTAESGKAGE